MSDVVVGSLCTGVAGLDLGVHAAYGGRTRLAWYSETNPDASTILAARIPGVPNLGDLTGVDWTTVAPVQVLTAGFPCQPVSAAGKQKGVDDERWLWDDVRRAYRILRPQELVFENVRNLVSIRKGMLFRQICDDLREDGYAVRWATAGACAVGGCHHRHRVFIVARYAWQLDPPPAQRITVAECGARRGKSRTLLPTPAGRYGNNQGGQHPVRPLPGQAHLLLPTPDAAAGTRGGPQDADVRRAKGQSVMLADAIWTVLSETGRLVPLNERRSGSLLLPESAALLPSPQASDGGRGPNPAAWPADNLTTAVDRLDTEGPAMLPTPRARDGHGGDYDADRQQQRRENSKHGGPSLPDVAQQILLPTPTAGDSRNSRNATAGRAEAASAFTGAFTLCDTTFGVGEGPLRAPEPGDESVLLPTPTVVDSHAGVQNIAPGERGASGYGPMLRDVAPTLPADESALLPTPRHTDAAKGSPNQHGSRPGDLMLPSAVIGTRYGRYAHAVALWEAVSGRPAPEPTIRNSKGQWRLNPELPEWMMGLPQGWITDLVGRSAALRGAGNGVVWQVVASVYPLITAGWRYLQGGEVCPDPIAPDPLTPATDACAPPARAIRRRARHAERGEQLTLC